MKNIDRRGEGKRETDKGFWRNRDIKQSVPPLETIIMGHNNFLGFLFGLARKSLLTRWRISEFAKLR